MKMKKSNDPWLEGQDQITFPIPGWISTLALIVKIPFRLVFGAIGLALGGARALSSESENRSTEVKRHLGDTQYYQDVDMYGESHAMYRATHNIK